MVSHPGRYRSCGMQGVKKKGREGRMEERKNRQEAGLERHMLMTVIKAGALSGLSVRSSNPSTPRLLDPSSSRRMQTLLPHQRRRYL